MAINVSEVQWDDAPKTDTPPVINPAAVKWDDTPTVSASAQESVRSVGSGIASEQAAKIFDIQKKTGLPPAFIERNLEPIKQKLIQADTREFAKLNPSTGAWLAESPYNTALAQDDFENMGAMERLTNIFKPVPALAAAGVVEAVSGAAGLLHGVQPYAFIGYDEQADKLRADVAAVRSQVAQENPLEPGSWSEATRSALTSIYSQAPAYAIGILTGGATIPLTMMGTQAGLQKASELEAGGVGKLGTVAGGLVSGLSEAGTELIPFKSLMGKKLVKFFLSEQFGEQINTAVDSIIDKVSIEPDMTWPEYIDRAVSTAKTTLVQSSIMGGGIGAVNLATRKPEQPQVKTEKQFIDEVGKLAESSKLRERAPAKFQEAMNRLFKGTNAENVYIPVEAWESYWQKQGVEPSVMAQEMGISPDAYSSAVASKGALQVSTDAYVRKIGPTEHNAFFADEVKLKSEGMNAREFKAFMENPDAFIDPAQQITDEVSRQLVATGRFTEEDANLQAEALYGAFFKTTGERAGVDPLELFRKYNLQVKGETAFLPPVKPEALPDGAVKLTKSQRRSLEFVRGEVESGEAGKRIFLEADEGGPPKVSSIPSSFPDYFQNKGYTKKETLNAIDKAMSGKPLGPRQMSIIEDLNAGYRDQAAKEIWTLRANEPKKVASAMDMSEEDVAALSDDEFTKLFWQKADEFELTSQAMKQKGVKPKQGSLFDIQPQFPEQKIATTDAGNPMLDELRRVEAEKGQGTLFQKDAIATETPEFKAWFGDSKVVDSEGKPLVVYHGTKQEIESYDVGKAGQTDAGLVGKSFYFTPSGEQAGHFALDKFYGEGIAPNVQPVFISLQNPFIIIDGVLPDGRTLTDIHPGGITIKSGAKIRAQIGKVGHDGVIFKTSTGEITQVAAFSPSQIKSVFNRGTFDPKDPRILFQKGKAPRGKITFGPGGVDIELLKNANLSSFLHETGHFWLKVLGDASKLETASADLKADYQTLLDWMGVKGTITTEQHEKFARGAEAYLREGKAPSAALRSAFAKFKSWLTEVYKSLRGLNVELTPEVISVFDRMLATQEDISAVQAEAEIAVIDLVAEGRDAESVTDEEIARLVPAYRPMPASEVKGQVREATGLKRTFEYIREDKALEAAWKKAEQSSRIAFKAGKTEEAAKWKEKMAEVVAQAKEKTAKILTEKQEAAQRRQSINTIVEYLGLTDAQVKNLTASKKDIRLMTDWEFKQFKDELLLRAVELQETNFAKARVAEVIERKHLKNSENYSAVLGYPPFNEMTADMLDEWADILEMFADGDVFLTERKLELVDRTELEGIRTWREAKEKLAEKTGVSIEELNNIKVSHLDVLRWDNALADQNPFYGLLVEKVTKTMMNAEMRAHDIESRIFELAKKSDKSRARGIVGRLIPQDKQIFAYLESPADEKGVLAAEMTPEQIDLAHYMQEYFAQALEYLIKTKSLEKGRENYFVHIRRTVLENIKEDGLVKAVKEVYKNYQQDEMVFGILDDATGRILPNEKFFQFSMRRTGALDPTYNIVKAFTTYTKTFEKKVALDSILPELDLYAQALTPLHMTPRGLEIDRSLKDFVYKYINNKKGRQIGFDKVISQGSPADLALRGLRSFTTVLDLGFSIPVGLGTYVGEQAANFVMLGPKDMARGTARIKTAKGKAILNKYEAFVGRSMWQEFTAPGKEITDNIMTGLFGFFHSSTVLANKQYLLGSLTEQEYNAGEISPERLAQMKIDMGRFRVVPGAKSIFGSTSLGSALMQYKSWAAGILRTTTKDMTTMMKDLRKKPVGEALTTREAHEIYRIIGVTTAALIVFGMGDEDDKSFIGRLSYKVRSESLSMISALSPLFWTGYPRIWTFMRQLAGNAQSLVLMEEYKTRSGLKGVEGLRKQFTPGALRGVGAEDKKN